MYVENANRATKEGFVTVDNLEPNPKNPIIAMFFRNIGYAEQLGSGVRKLFKYSKYYSGKDPQFIEDDVFRLIVPLDDDYSFDYSVENGDNTGIETKSADEGKVYWVSLEELKTRELATGMKYILQMIESEQVDECYMHLETEGYVETLY